MQFAAIDLQKTGARLKALRLKAGLGTDNLAEKVGTTRTAIYKWESGQTLPNIDNLVTLADIYGETIDSLIIREEKESGDILVFRCPFMGECFENTYLKGACKAPFLYGKESNATICCIRMEADKVENWAESCKEIGRREE